MVHPDQVMNAAEIEKFPLVEPVYPLTSGLGQRQVAKAVRAALEGLPALPEWQNAPFASKSSFAVSTIRSQPSMRPSIPLILTRSHPLCAVLPMTNCLQANWPFLLSAAACAA